MQTEVKNYKALFSFPVIIAALGYFVDVYDLLLFGIVRVPSLKAMGLNPDVAGSFILNWQMLGLLLGGILWGVLGDKRGRLSVLFGSILVYSLANLACGYLPHYPIEDKTMLYAMLRFVAGIGLAGELGAGITLVSESLPKNLRAIGSSLVAGFGLLGAVAAQLCIEFTNGNWSLAYYIGGAMGISLLLLRIKVLESGMYQRLEQHQHIEKGNFLSFFSHKKRFIKYIKCICIGLPTWFCIGILAVLSNQFAAALGIESLKPGKAIMWAYVGISAGDFASGFFSQWLKSRKKAILYMMLFSLIGAYILLYTGQKTENGYYQLCVFLGFCTGYWAMFVTLSAEQFGSNIRSTATTTVPNMVRGILALMIMAFNGLKPSLGVIYAASAVGLVVYALAIWASLSVEETHGKDLDFIEEPG
jgi:MFS family permease